MVLRIQPVVPVDPEEDTSTRAFRRWMLLLTAVLAPAEILLAARTHLDLRGPWGTTLLGLAALIAVTRYCGWRGLRQLGISSELAAWSVVHTNVISILMQLAGRSPFPLIDAKLAASDRALHFNTVAMVHWGMEHPLAQLGLSLCYASVELLIVGSVLLLPFLGHSRAARQFILSIVIAAMVTAAVFAICPAVGPWTTSVIAPAVDQQRVQAYLLLLKSHGPVKLDMENAGIVAFPSFHVLLAAVSAVALGSVRRLRVAVWALAVLIVFSTLTSGWHYLTDVIGGVALSALANGAAWSMLRQRAAAEVAEQEPQGVLGEEPAAFA